MSFFHSVAIIFLVAFNASCNHKKSINIDLSNYSKIDSFQKTKTEGSKIDLKTMVISSNGDSCDIENIVSDSLLYVRFSNYACQECVEFMLTKLYDRTKLYKCMFLVSDMPLRDMHVYEARNKGLSLYLLDSLNVDFDGGLTPYLFRIENGKIRDFFIPRIENEVLFDEYLHSKVIHFPASPY